MPRSRTLVLPLLLATALVGSIAPASLAQDDVSTSAGVNADRVDGLDAVKATGKTKQRANKLVATNKQGLLPSNILRPLWGLIQGLPAVLADGQVSWNELVGIPGDLTDGQVGWGEIVNKPVGFADGVDDAGVTGVKVLRVVGPNTIINADANGTAFGQAEAVCPAGAKVTGGGFASTAALDFILTGSYASALDTWRVEATYTKKSGEGGTSIVLQPIAMCMSIEPTGALTVAKKGLLPAKVKQALKKRGR